MVRSKFLKRGMKSHLTSRFWLKRFLILSAGALVVVSLSYCYAQRPQTATQQQRPRTVSGGRATTLGSGGDLQAAINSAKPGDTITLAAGATFRGPIVLPAKKSDASPDSYITIQTASLDALPDGVRVSPTQASSMPKIVSPGGQSSIETAPGAHHYRFIGIEFAPAADSKYIYNLINIGSDEYSELPQFPHHLIFDRCYVHSTGLGKARRGFALNGGETSITNSYISGFAGPGDETQGICGWNGPGPFHIINNQVEGGGQNIFFGGGDPRMPGLVPSDVEIRRNFIYKPEDWKGKATIKAMFEMKNVRRLIIDGNMIIDAHTTTAFALTVRNQGGTAPWSAVQEVQITNNVIKHANMAVNILGRDNEHPSQQAKQIRIANNLFIDMGVDNSAFVQTSGADSITVEHNTVQHTGNVITSYGAPTSQFVFSNNILQNNNYGVFCESGKLASCLPGAVFAKNIIVDNYDSASQGSPLDRYYPPGNFFPRSLQEVGFVNLAQADFRLAETSHFRKRATDGKDIGVDFEELLASGVLKAGQ